MFSILANWNSHKAAVEAYKFTILSSSVNAYKYPFFVRTDPIGNSLALML